MRTQRRIRCRLVLLCALIPWMAGCREEGRPWTPRSVPLDQWAAVPVPAGWDSLFLTPYRGFAWYRCFVRVPESWQEHRLLLTVGEIDHVDEAFVNGHLVGANGSLPPLYRRPASTVRRPFLVPPEAVRFGDFNEISFRVYDPDGPGGVVAGPIQLSLAQEAIDLSGLWEMRAGDDPTWRGDPHRDTEATSREARAFLQRVGSGAAGQGDLAATDTAHQEALIARVQESFRDNPNPYSNLEGKGAPLHPQEALETLEPAPGLAVDLVLSEPLVRQPVSFEFDSRGRLWITQYLQYPDPAGLKFLTWDGHLRKTFDTTPPPPPYRKAEHRKFVGADKVSIHEDTDGDGAFDLHKTFVEGLNIATSSLQGEDGVWVLNPPYLLYYPDADRDDVPDRDPIVHLSGFGLEDTHSVANSLKWGPDGWLYGATGSTVTARVRTEQSPSRSPFIFLGQTIWRYHPGSHRFELFAQGGFNNFGVDFDDKGRLFSGTNGRVRAVHFVQGGYYQKNFGKHGPFTNPFMSHYLSALPYQGEEVRMVHQWLPYGGGAIDGYEGTLIGANALTNWIMTLRLEPQGSSFTTRELHKTVRSPDKWFRPVYSGLGPEGAVYVADWYDARITHVDPRDNWDRERGRIYRLRDRKRPAGARVNLADATSAQLLKSLEDSNRWVRQTARRELKGRTDPSLREQLIQRLQSKKGQLALEALWTIHWREGLAPDTAEIGLKHRDPYLRLWTVRLLGDASETISPQLHQRILEMAVRDPHPEVLSQIAATAQRLPTGQSLQLLARLLKRSETLSDPHIPSQIWWALERHLESNRELLESFLLDPSVWALPYFETFMAGRLGERLTRERSLDNFDLSARLLETTSTTGSLGPFLGGLGDGLEGNPVASAPDALAEVVTRLWKERPASTALAGLALRLGVEGARQRGLTLLKNPELSEQVRLSLLHNFESRLSDANRTLMLDLLDDSSAEIRLAALGALRHYSGEGIESRILPLLLGPDPRLQQTAQLVLAGRLGWAHNLLDRVSSGELSLASIHPQTLTLLLRYEDERLQRTIDELWGDLRQSEAALGRRIGQVRRILATGAGDPGRGAVHFQRQCGSCHRFKGSGREVGPDLDGYELDNLESLIPAIVHPNLGIREGYETANLGVYTQDGGVTLISGFILQEDEGTVKIRDLDGRLLTLPRGAIQSMRRENTSIMPQGLLDSLDEEAVRDLFAYLVRR